MVNPVRTRRGRSARVRLVLLCFGLFLCCSLAAQTELSAREAIHWALDGNTEVAIARAELASARGLQLGTAGRLDPSLRINATFAGLRGELIPALVRQQTGNRTLLESLDREFTDIAEQLSRELAASPNTVSLQCGLGNEILINNRNICENPEVARERQRLDMLLTTLARSAGGDSELELDIGRLQDDLRRSNRQFIERLIDTLRTVARGNRNARRDLGEVPEIEIASTLTLDLSWFHPLRNGWSITPQLILENKRDNFEGKPRSSRFGGKGLKMVTRSALGVSFSAPFGRGGRDSIESEQNAAILRADASEQALRFTAQRSTSRVLDGYWRLLAARRQLDLIERQIQSRAQLVGFSSALAEADEISRSQVLEPEAQWRQAQADAIQARQSVEDANENLRLILGRELSVAPNLFPTSDFPPFQTTCLPDLASLAESAKRARGDLRSLELAQRAAEQSSLQARDALKPKLDVSLTLGFAGREENEALLQGYEQSLFDGLAGPSILLTFSGELGVKNRRAQGQLESSLELAQQAQLRHQEASWQLRRELLDTRNRVDALAREGEQRKRTVAAFEQLLSDTRFALKAGELEPSDALTTELQAFDAESALISVQQRFASALADLGFRSGALIAESTPMTVRPGVEKSPWSCR